MRVVFFELADIDVFFAVATVLECSESAFETTLEIPVILTDPIQNLTTLPMRLIVLPFAFVSVSFL